ncbi:hypothetical protein N7481_000026 [Penicillium waksmanii]|uniref:uncharacterized protein n=1 Tax=Penicillium waksmanii TaxID=69791 RepID=UPI0025482471|nr:uncharacterized protein N7481_000026 [Penicillium waksmanii]KAJ5999617.1 hypothetical protein N7481_000026 [Penicillium waksmanii]
MQFRIASTSSFQPSTRRRRRKVRYYDPPIPKAQSEIVSGIPPVQIIREPSEVWSHHVIPLVLDKFSVELVDTTIDGSMFATIPRIIFNSQEGSPVYAVCDAIASAYLANTTGTIAATTKRTLAYGTALRTVNLALSDPVQCKNDSTLLAVWMFVVYEVIIPLPLGVTGRKN